MHRYWWRCFSLLFLILFTIPSSPVQAQSKAAAESGDLLGQLRSIELRMKKIEANEQEILARQEKILTELENLRVWVARR